MVKFKGNSVEEDSVAASAEAALDEDSAAVVLAEAVSAEVASVEDSDEEALVEVASAEAGLAADSVVADSDDLDEIEELSRKTRAYQRNFVSIPIASEHHVNLSLFVQ